MSKKSRSERRKAQLQRAVQQGTPSALRAIADRNAEAGARAILQAIEASPETASQPEIADMAAAVCERLRADDGFELALRLASVFGRATPRLCLEEALAAFALGEDTRALEAAAAHREVQQALAPVLAVASSGRVPNTPAGASPPFRGLIALARAVTALRNRRSSNALAALRQIPDDASGRLFVSEMRLAADVITGRPRKTEDAALALGRTPLLQRYPRAAAALAQCLATRTPKRFVDVLAARIPLSPQAKAEAMIQASVAAAGLDTDAARVSMIVAKLGHAAFPSGQKGVAALWEGFAFAFPDPQRAQKAFDKAVALGADMGEALRGRFLALREEAKDAEQRGDIDRAARLYRAAASTALRLASAVSRMPGASALAATAALAAADLLQADPDIRPLLEAVRAARAYAERAGLLGDELEGELLFYEAHGVPENKPERALELVEQALVKSPRHGPSWDLRITLTQIVHGTQAMEDVVLQAGELRITEDLAEQARAIRIARGQPVQIAAAGKVTAGELAAELKRRCKAGEWTGTPTPYEGEVAQARAQLSGTQQCALDAGAFVTLRENGCLEGAALLARLVGNDVSAVSDTAFVLAVVSAILEWDDAIVDLVRHASTPERAGALAQTAIDAMLRAGRAREAQKLVLQVASLVKASQFREITGLVDSAMRGKPWHSLIGPGELVRDAVRELAPHFTFPAKVDALVTKPPPRASGPARLRGGLSPDNVRMLLRTLGVSEAQVRDIAPAELSALGAEVLSLAVGKPNKAAARRLAELLTRYGIEIDDDLDAYGMP